MADEALTKFDIQCRDAVWEDFDLSAGFPARRPHIAHYTSLEVLERLRTPTRCGCLTRC